MTARRLFLAAVLGLLCAGCSGEKALTAAERGVERFREQVAAKQFSQIYSEATEELRKDTVQYDRNNTRVLIKEIDAEPALAADASLKAGVRRHERGCCMLRGPQTPV